MSKLKIFRDERRGMRREVVIDWKSESEGEDGKKMEGIKRGALPYVATSSYEFPNNGKVSLFSFSY